MSSEACWACRAEPWAEAGSLTANVWAPVGARDLPVMVWVHGGGYVGGSNSSPRTDGARLAAAGQVVVVALSYRLGVFGFFPAFAELGDGFEDAANLGILDLIAGLEWVRDNVSAFGGDPGVVTAFGQSAGAAAVGTMLGMPRARGLFRRAIMQSGTAERARTPDEAGEVSGRFLHASGLTPETSRDLLDWPAERLLAAQRAFAEVIARGDGGAAAPVPAGHRWAQHPSPAARCRAGWGGERCRPDRGHEPQRRQLLHRDGRAAARAPTSGSPRPSKLSRAELPRLTPRLRCHRATGPSSKHELGRDADSPRDRRGASSPTCSTGSRAIACSRLGRGHRVVRSPTCSSWLEPRHVPGLGSCHTLEICRSCSGSSTTPRTCRSSGANHPAPSARR